MKKHYFIYQNSLLNEYYMFFTENLILKNLKKDYFFIKRKLINLPRNIFAST